MKKILSSLPIIAMAGLTIFTACKKKADDVVPVDDTKPSVTVKFIDSDYGTLQDIKVSAEVSTQGDSAYIFLTVDGTKKTSYIYMQKSEDNAEYTKWKSISGPLKGTSLDGTTTGNFTEEATIGLLNYTYSVPSALDKAFKLTIPIVLRNVTSAKSDVFRLWITNGVGSYNNPGNSLAYGVAEITFNYSNDKLITNYTTELGNTASSGGSLFSTATGSTYRRDTANARLQKES